MCYWPRCACIVLFVSCVLICLFISYSGYVFSYVYAKLSLVFPLFPFKYCRYTYVQAYISRNGENEFELATPDCAGCFVNNTYKQILGRTGNFHKLFFLHTAQTLKQFELFRLSVSNEYVCPFQWCISDEILTPTFEYHSDIIRYKLLRTPPPPPPPIRLMERRTNQVRLHYSNTALEEKKND